jgi:phosphate transport system substrate-binding protein
MNSPILFRFFALFIGVTIIAAPSQAALTARGSDSTINIVKALAAAFQQKTGTTVQVGGGGSGAGTKAAIAGEVQLAFLSRALDAKEKEAGLVGVAYATDAVAVIVHQDNPVANLSLAELKDYFTGKTAAWPDGRPVVLYNRNADSGTREIFQDKVLGKGVAFSPTAAIKHDGVLLSAVAKIPVTLAYDGYGHADPKTVKLVSVDGVAPNPETIRSSAYPLTRTPTLATKGEAGGEAKAFIDFVLSAEGQAVVSANGLLALK